MEKLVVQGKQKLAGEVGVSGAKNAALPIIFSSLLADGEHFFKNVPALRDITSTCELLNSLNCTTHFENNELKIKVTPPKTNEAHYDYVRKMRASILCLGPMLAKYGEAVVSLPGGCAIGTRPIDLHLDAFKELGAEIKIEQGYVHASCKKLKGARVLFELVTVGGTENLMMGACLADGITTIENAAKEPEIVDLANYLNAMGARVKGAGSGIITIEGVEKLKPAEYTIVSDRIEAGTLVAAGAITGSQITVTNCVPEHLDSFLKNLEKSGFKFEIDASSITVLKNKGYVGVDMSTAPHPLFPTDLQAQYMALMCGAEGKSVITENVFENRFMHVPELNRMGADIMAKTKVAVVNGKPGQLTAAPVMATDLRASASLVLAGLVAEGETTVNRIYHLDRGYERLEQKLSSLGANIKRV